MNDASGGRRLHATAVTGMIIFACLGVLSTLAFITVSWPGGSSRYVLAVAMGCVIGFVACATAAVFTAARDTYPRRHSGT